MEYRKLGNSGLDVSPLCLGTMMFGLRTDARTAGRMVDSARAQGVNFIDTADAYSNGESERITGRCIKRDRDDWVLATKVGVPMGRGPNQRGLGRKRIVQAIDASLKRLGTDYVDIYYLHLDDEKTPLEESLSAMDDVVGAGKARYWGFSNYRGWRIGEMMRVVDSLGLTKPVVCQPYYNAMNRMPEVEVLPACAHYGIGVAPYSPVARGVLTGKYPPGKAPAKGTRAGHEDRRMMQAEWRKESLVRAQRIRKHAETRGMSAAQFAVLWVLNNAIVTSVIAGPRTAAQWKEYLGALDHEFTAKDEALIDKMVPAGHPSTPGFTDPIYPVRGRAARTG